MKKIEIFLVTFVVIVAGIVLGNHIYELHAEIELQDEEFEALAAEYGIL